MVTKTPQEVFRGVPADANYQPKPADAQILAEEMIADTAAVADRVTTIEGQDLDTRTTSLESVAISGTIPRAAADLATTANVTLSGEQTIDGTLTSTSDVIVRAQANPAQNGVYTTAAGAWTRRSDMDAAGEVQGAMVYVTGGTVGAGKTFYTGSEVVTLGTDPIVWVATRDQSALAVQVADVEDGLSSVPAKTIMANDDLEVGVDIVGNAWRRTANDGHQYLPHMDDQSVQQAISETKERVYEGAGSVAQDVLSIEDADGNVTMRQDARGAVYLPGLAGPVQGVVGQTLTRERRFPTARDKLHSTVAPMIASLRTEGLPFIEPPALLVPNNAPVPSGIVDAYSVTEGTGVMLETPYGPGGNVHPYLLEVRRPLMGYRYIMGETPHKNANAWEENPIIYGSNDLQTFDLLPDCPMPLGHPPGNQTGYNSDIALGYDPNTGEMFAVWRQVGAAAAITFHYRSTWDGVNWTDEVSHSQSGIGWLSPSILYDPIAETWRLWVLPTENTVRSYTGPTKYGPWTVAGSQDLNATDGIAAWHCEVKWMGEAFVMLVNDRANLFLGYSTDGTNWTIGDALISDASDPVYKGSFVPEFDGDNMRLHVCWNTYAYPSEPGMALDFHSRSTDWVDLTAL
ncbi:hypothetical protein [Oceaniglobus ichthyenteri]|uniref:hypothetical protein n=1 Tax=Oceaniglobus ichthyenteri TaxID=2136177 RepID=UPI000D3BD0F9|nr:hypothetical protein [Oceaniglobus ichthyenteri]